MPSAVRRKAKTIAANNRARMYDNIITNHTIKINFYTRKKGDIIANSYIIGNISIRINFTVIANFNIRANISKSANINIFTNFADGCIKLGCSIPVLLSFNGIIFFKQYRKRTVGIFYP